MPNLLNSKEGLSEYSYFDANKLKLFAGPNIWKFTNLLNTSTSITAPITNANISIIQEKQAPITPRKLANLARVGGTKRTIRIDIFNQTPMNDIMFGNSDKRSAGTSQSSLLLRIREKSLNQMQLARKIRPLNDLTNLHNFPDLNIQHLDLLAHRRERQQEQYYDQEDFIDHHQLAGGDDDDSKLFVCFVVDTMYVYIHINIFILR